jgi:hypothetical protein
MSGENPLLAAANDTAIAMTEAEAGEPMMSDAPHDNGNRPLGRPNGALPQLKGIAQVIGLALGSPEFQRR